MIFGEDYSRIYDLIYSDKDYKKECDFIEEIFSKHGVKPKSILDVGCGTGNHAIILATRGYEVIGVDRSVHMINVAKAKADRLGVKAKFICGNLQDIKFEKKFDSVISMFAVMSYQLTNQDVSSFCRFVKENLIENGIFISDFWYGPAVLLEKPQNRIKRICYDAGEIIRISESSLDIENQTVAVNITILEISQNRIANLFSERHIVRYFFPQEIRYFLETARFSRIYLYPFLDTNRNISEKDWNVTVVAIS